MSGRLAANDIGVLVRAALAGLGLALVPDAVVARNIRAGELETVLRETIETDASISVVFADREFIEPRVRVFVDRAVAFLHTRFSSPVQ